MQSSNASHSIRPGLAPRRSRARQSGLTFFGLLVYVVFVLAGVFVVLKVVPSVNEFQAIKGLIRQVAQSNPSSVEEAKRVFDRQRKADPSIQSITGNDLIVSKEAGRVVIAVRYEKELRMVGPVSLLIRYEASSD